MLEIFDLYLKTPLVFFHFVLAAFALVTVVRLDFIILGTYTLPVSPDFLSRIKRAQGVMILYLLGLWVTGLLLVVYGAFFQPEFLFNQKLWCKLAVVVVLTLNGGLVHRLSKHVEVNKSFSEFSAFMGTQLCAVGAISSVSWLWACFLGVARPWNHVLPWQMIGHFYAATLGLAILVAVTWHHFHLRRCVLNQ